MKLIPKSNFTSKNQNKPISLYTLKNKHGITCQITNFGGKVVNLWVKDSQGNFRDVVLGFDSIDDYRHTNEIYFGALIGRFGNRIAGGNFNLNDKTYRLDTNNGKNHLHGGVGGFHNVVWDAEQLSDFKLKLHYISKDGEEGYPGNLNVEVFYSITDDNELKIEYSAKTDKSTPVNLTHHSYFNLEGAGIDTIIHHKLQINADYFSEVNEEQIPIHTKSVEGTPFDFRSFKPIGKDIKTPNKQLKIGVGYDHNYILNGDGLKLAATVKAPKSGIIMDVLTTEPGMQFFSGNFLNEMETGKNGSSYSKNDAFCLESQHFPDSPNQPEYPTTILNPGEVYRSLCIYKFSN